jgi:hypothetical protein
MGTCRCLSLQHVLFKACKKPHSKLTYLRRLTTAPVHFSMAIRGGELLRAKETMSVALPCNRIFVRNYEMLGITDRRSFYSHLAAASLTRRKMTFTETAPWMQKGFRVTSPTTRTELLRHKYRYNGCSEDCINADGELLTKGESGGGWVN